jgi:hypothetical protein
MASSRSTSVSLRNSGFHVGWQRKRDLVSLYSSGERDEGPHVKTLWAGYSNPSRDVLKAWQRMSGAKSLDAGSGTSLGNNWY